MVELSALNHLLKASSKTTVEKCLNLAFVSRFEHSKYGYQPLEDILEISETEAEQLHAALLECIQVTLSAYALEALAELFQEKGSDVNPKLKQLIGQCVSGNLENWREAAAFNRVSLPRLIDTDWTMHLKKASSEVMTMHVPMVVVQLQVESQSQLLGDMPEVNKVNFELSKEALETMLDGLGKIRDQLSSMGGASR